MTEGSPLRVGERMLGVGHPCFIAAEVGINHNGDLDCAHRSIDAAADAGADAVKFQNYRTEDFLSDRSLTYEYVSRGRTVRESQYEMFKRCELTRESLGELARHCAARKVVFFSTPTSEEGVLDIVQAGGPLLKNGSDYLSHLPLIEAMARSGLPTILSTGMATLGEVDDAVRAFRGAGGRQLVLLVCTSSYPAPPGDVHLRRIPAMEAAFACPVGFSDHSDGTIAAVGAVALGACMVEKHFTLDRDLAGPDHRFSMDPAELTTLVAAIRTIEQALGDATLGPAASEALGRQGFRLSCVARGDLPGGHVLTPEDVVFRRPGTGLPPKGKAWLIGLRLARDVCTGHVFAPLDFGP